MLDFVRHRLLPIWRLSERQLVLVPVIVVLGLTAAALEGLGIGLVIPLLAVVTGSGDIGGSGVATWLRSFAGEMEPSARIGTIALVMFALILLKNLLAAANAALSAYVCGQAGHRIRTALAQRLLTADYPFMRDQEPGALMNVLSNESWRAADAVNATLNVLVNACAALILYGFLLALSWKLALIITVALVFMLLVHGVLAKRLRAPSRLVSAESGKLSARMLDIIHAAQLIRLFNQESHEQSRFDAASGIGARHSPCSRFAKFGAPGVGESWARGADGGARGRLRLARCCRGRGLRLVAGRGADLGRGSGGCRSGTPAAAPEALLLPRDDDAERRAPRAPLPNLVRA